MLWIICCAVPCLLACLSAVFLIHRRVRQAKTAAAAKIEGDCGIVEERFIWIGGIDQWIGIRGEDISNPVLLLIHGGPGSSYSIFTPHLRAWEKYFTIVQWDQRGAGKTFARTGRRASGNLSMEQLARDGLEVAEYLRVRLNKKRIFLMASSFGSTFGLEMVRRGPDLFHAYIGTDQNVGMVRGRDETRCATIERLQKLGLNKGVKALERIGPDPTRWTPDEFEVVTRWTMKSDPPEFLRTIKLLKGAVLYAPGWTLRDIRAFVAGMRFSLEQMLHGLTTYDAWAQGTRFDIPIFIFQGENDLLTTPARAREFFNDVIAPSKRMELIADAGHFAAFLQPNQFLKQLLDHVRPLAGERSYPFEAPDSLPPGASAASLPRSDSVSSACSSR